MSMQKSIGQRISKGTKSMIYKLIFKKWYRIVILGIICLVCSSVLYIYVFSSRNDFKFKLQEAIQSSCTDTASKVVMKKLTDYTWDGLYIFGPYMPPSEIEKALGFAWPPAKTSGIELSDAFCLLVFTHGKSVKQYYEYPRQDGDWSALSSMTRISPDNAVFLAREDKGIVVLTMAVSR